VSTHWERKERAREEKLKLIDEQVESGSLVIRPMTAAERKANPVRPPRPKPWEKRARSQHR
jgi:hypothetical protein